MPAKGVTEPTGPSEPKTQPVPGNLQEAVLADGRPGPPARALPAAGQLEEAQAKGGAGAMGFADRCCRWCGEDMGRVKHEGFPELTHLCALEHASPQLSYLLQCEGCPPGFGSELT